MITLKLSDFEAASVRSALEKHAITLRQMASGRCDGKLAEALRDEAAVLDAVVSEIDVARGGPSRV